MPEELAGKTVRQLGELIRTRQVSAADVTEAFLTRVQRFDPQLNAFVTITAAHARSRARALDAETRGGQYRGPLHGIPYAPKDLLATRGIRTTNGSKITASWVPEYNSTIIDRLDTAGAIMIGKLNLREFGTGSGVLSGFGLVRNPWGFDYTSAGSSSGSGAAVAARLTPLSIGTDTGGSIRGPAAVCGIVGLKPTYGRVSLSGVTPLSWSLDHAGPMAATVADAALLLQAIAGHDPKDPSSAAEAVPDYVAALDGGVKGLRVGLPTRHFSEGMHRDVEKAYHQAIAVLESLGVNAVPVDIPHADLATPAGNLIAMAEAATFHETRLRASPELFDPLVRERLETAGFYLATDYVKAQRLRTLLVKEVVEALRGCDAVAVPAYPRLPARVESPAAARTDVTPGEAPAPYRASNSYIANMTGVPALVLPCGFSSGPPPLPIALQLYGRHFEEATLLRLGHAYQQATDWHTRRPPLS